MSSGLDRTELRPITAHGRAGKQGKEDVPCNALCEGEVHASTIYVEEPCETADAWRIFEYEVASAKVVSVAEAPEAPPPDPARVIPSAWGAPERATHAYLVRFQWR